MVHKIHKDLSKLFPTFAAQTTSSLFRFARDEMEESPDSIEQRTS